MEEERRKLIRKLMDAADQEIARFTCGETEYVEWLGKNAALVTSTMAACNKLMELAEEQGKPLDEKIKFQMAFLTWYGHLAGMIASQMETLGGMIGSTTGAMLPFALLEALVGMYVAAHRTAYALWRDQDETRLLWKDVPTSVN